MRVKTAVLLFATTLMLWAAPASAADEGGTSASVALPALSDMAGGPRRSVLKAALAAYEAAIRHGSVARTGLLTVIDYTLPSTEPRLWVLDLDEAKVLYRELVAHGRASGDNVAKQFSNRSGSLMSSIGLFVTDETYIGQNGYSLRLRGLEPGVNDHAYDRAIVMHGAAYVDEGVVGALGRLGRSLGCPAVRLDIAQSLIDTIKDGTVMYAYGGAKRAPAASRVKH
jgi:hypothetical protein